MVELSEIEQQLKIIPKYGSLIEQVLWSQGGNGTHVDIIIELKDCCDRRELGHYLNSIGRAQNPEIIFHQYNSSLYQKHHPGCYNGQ